MLFYALTAAFGLLLQSQLVVTASAPPQYMYQDLQQQLSCNSSVFLPSYANWTTDVRHRWTTYFEPTYRAAVQPGCEEDVAKAVVIAQQYKVPFMATGGGHGYTASYGMRGAKQILEIDLSKFQQIEVDANANTLTVGPGVRISQIMDPVYNAGKEFTIGSCSCPSVIGISLGAGLGRYQGIHGLMIDNLLSVRMVTAAGKKVVASATQNPDLFWGIRGAGFDFGIITEATYRVHNQTNGGQLMNADLQFSGKDNQSFFEALKTYDNGKLDPKLSLFIVTGTDAAAQSPDIILNAVYLGNQTEGEALIKPFLDIGPTVQNITTITSNNLLKSALFGLDTVLCEDGLNRNSYSLNVVQTSVPTYVDTFNKYSDFQNQYPQAANSSLEFVYLPNQAVQAIPENSTAYPWRNEAASVMFTFGYPANDSVVDTAANALAVAARSNLQKTSGVPKLQVYVNGAHGDETADELYGSTKLPALLNLKKTWDPTNQFRFNNPLPYTAA